MIELHGIAIDCVRDSNDLRSVPECYVDFNFKLVTKSVALSQACLKTTKYCCGSEIVYNF